ncbi:RagB/SusD family nutrient uptake outer membrane protein [Sphingobacterium bovistauri]|uniref:RagB/SusD family nutrient uptake outer membrane protein n=1 Tax=Sphingobacterium bovistauri TaxID=2781959 RepID=A0ABS7Z2L9_9SPHI|nr:RagB/SusD family nutrient uptake outer membrane protein [Sphingobacterium bovistauri]MCA5004351.1 RagB/SusD family nutrient uptake outer membrane protein [Sphingobacterium bovistauri]
MNQYLGEAHLVRAYYYLNLVLRYAKAYNATTADADLGVPLVTSFDLNELPKRASLKESYTLILDDITKAKTLLSGVNGVAGSNKFTIDAVFALEARAKLYMGDLEGAKNAAETVLKGGKYKLFNTDAGVKSIWAVDATQETILQLFASKIERPNQNSIYYGYEANSKTYRPNFVPSQWVIDSYSAGDFRKAAYFKEVKIYKSGKEHTGTIVNKYPGNPVLINSEIDNHNAPKVFRVAELYLISAEASVVSDPANALARLNELRVARGLSALSGLSGTALMNEVKAERFRELAFEGFRLDDLKRWNEGMTRKSPQSTDFLETGVGYINLSIPAGHDKFVWGIPSYEITLNSNLSQNKGW